jgi:hypothetical protein
MLKVDLGIKQLDSIGIKAVVNVDYETGYAEGVEVVDGPTYKAEEIPEEAVIDTAALDQIRDMVLRACLIGMKRYRNILRTSDESWLKVLEHLNSVTGKSLRAKSFVIIKHHSEDAGFDYPVKFSVDSIFEDSIVISWFCEGPCSPLAFEANLEVHDFESPIYPPPLVVDQSCEFSGVERSAEIQNLIPGKWYRVKFRAVGGQWCEPPVDIVTKKAYAK